jgi:hypothetical protein
MYGWADLRHVFSKLKEVLVITYVLCSFIIIWRTMYVTDVGWVKMNPSTTKL